MTDIVAVVGPTASGKTSLGVEIAKRMNGEVVSADSMQIYKQLNIGTAKPTQDEMQGIPHHLIDFVPPSETFSLEQYAKAAHSVIAEISQRGKLPVIVGGTGLYIDTVINNIKLSDMSSDTSVREKLYKEDSILGTEKMLQRLREVDFETAQKLNVNDKKRILRALEIYETTGKTKSFHDKNSMGEKIYNAIVFGIDFDRGVLYDRINKRVDIMIKDGLIEETERVISLLKDSKTTALQSIGYKEIAKYLSGEMSLDEATELLKKNTRNLAKRQLTWFRRNKEIIWLSPELGEENMVDTCLKIIGERMKNSGKKA